MIYWVFKRKVILLTELPQLPRKWQGPWKWFVLTFTLFINFRNRLKLKHENKLQKVRTIWTKNNFILLEIGTCLTFSAFNNNRWPTKRVSYFALIHSEKLAALLLNGKIYSFKLSLLLYSKQLPTSINFIETLANYILDFYRSCLPTCSETQGQSRCRLSPENPVILTSCPGLPLGLRGWSAWGSSFKTLNRSSLKGSVS